MKRWTALTAAFTLAASAGLCLAQEGDKPAPAKPADKQPAAKKAVTLKVGDPAPSLSVEKWVKGQPVTGFEKGRVYVVEFWATWCGPCIASMPHLSSLQKEFKDKGLTVIGVTSKDSRGNDLEAVEKMVETKGDKMGYTVAWDQGRKTNEAYMEAAGKNGIPCSFVVDQKGNIAFIGHPMQLDYVLGSVIDNKWDYKDGPEKAEAEFKKLADEQRAIRRALDEDPKAALKLMDEFDAKHPKNVFPANQRLKVELDAGVPGAAATANKVADQLIEEGDAEELNAFAWGMVDPDGDIKNPPLDAALKAAQKAVDLTKEKNGAILDTLARVYWLKGDKGKAIDIQRKAVANADAQFKDELEARLKEYEAGSKN